MHLVKFRPMKLEVCYSQTNDTSARALCEEIQVSTNGHDVRLSLLNANKPTTYIMAEHVFWIRPYAAPKRVRAKKAGTQ